MSPRHQATLSSPSTSPTQPLKAASKASTLEGLNSEQQRAVVSADGPLLILAGAGTGKTKVIAHRIAHLLQSDPDLRPDNILALTFSRKAAAELMGRVEKLVGTYADELGVFTFHSFCHRFLIDHAPLIGLPNRFRLLDRLEAWIFFRKILPQLHLSCLWNPRDPTECIDGFLRFISRAKDECIRPEDYAAYASKISEPSQQLRAEEMARVYQTFQEKTRAAGALDFGDLILETLQGLDRNPPLALEVQKRYRFILVDEFQDTNVAQIKLLHLLAGEQGNLCVVGDDDQAIYRFRGASFASFLLMKEAFPAVQHVRLTQNYRSSQHILKVAERLIRHNEPDRYDPEKQLWTQNTEGQPVQVVYCPDELSEARWAVKTIQSLMNDPACGPAHPGEIAVLYRAHAHRDRLADELCRARIPFWVDNAAELFEQDGVKDIVAFLRILRDPSDSISLFRLLAHPLWGIPTDDLYLLGRWARDRKLTFHQALGTAKEEADFSAAAQEAFRLLHEEWARAGKQAMRSGIGELVPWLLEHSFFRAIFRLPTSGYQDPLLWLGRFLRWVYRYAQDHPDEQDLSSFLWTVDCILEAGVSSSDDENEPNETVGDQVRLMTVHQAKGLEFSWVILMSLVQGRFPGRSRPEAIPFPVELMRERLPQGDYHLQEERRLCYVACTRAIKGLFLLTQERPYHRPSIFVREILEGASDEVATSFSKEPGMSNPLQEPQVYRGPSMDKGAPTHLPPLERFSYTQLETYRYCPMKYRYRYLYHIPTRPTPDMALGTDVHACLEAFFRQVMNGTIPSCAELLDTYERCLTPGRYGEPSQEQAYRRLGNALLTAFYRTHEGQWRSPLFVEKSFLLPVGDAWIRGVVDRIDPLAEGGVEIVDYKTGKPKETAEPNERLQLQLYALACRRVFGLEPKRTSFYYLRTNQKLSFEIRPEDLEETFAQVETAVATIRTGDFTPTPSLMKCRRCDFRNLCPASLAS